LLGQGALRQAAAFAPDAHRAFAGHQALDGFGRKSMGDHRRQTDAGDARIEVAQRGSAPGCRACGLAAMACSRSSSCRRSRDAS
jgi:hypothetical protein